MQSSGSGQNSSAANGPGSETLKKKYFNSFCPRVKEGPLSVLGVFFTLCTVLAGHRDSNPRCCNRSQSRFFYTSCELYTLIPVLNILVWPNVVSVPCTAARTWSQCWSRSGSRGWWGPPPGWGRPRGTPHPQQQTPSHRRTSPRGGEPKHRIK